jgi:hypothetical protein
MDDGERIMSEETDSIHVRIFALIREAWDEVLSLVDGINQREGEEAEKAPESFLVGEYENAILNDDWNRVADPLLRVWLFDGISFIEQDIESGISSVLRAEQTVANTTSCCHTQGRVAFHITPNREQVLLTFFLGPRYGRGTVYHVLGQNQDVELVPIPLSGWVS